MPASGGVNPLAAHAGRSWTAPGVGDPVSEPPSAVNPKFTCSSANIQIDCTGVTDLGSSCTADRDNTGAGNEAYTFEAIDGAGNVIYTLTNSVPVGPSYPIGSFSWSTPPLFNPIRLRFISLAGNSLPEQVVLDIVGTCPGLPIGPLGLPPARPVDAYGGEGLVLLLAVLGLTAVVVLRRG
jgi:hypothetical protein